jgi:L-lysine exporter family protein LysE/ArgO
VLVFLQGFGLGAALIIPLGPQNTLVLNLGIRQQFACLAAGFCVLSDALLIFSGLFGGNQLLSQSPLAVQIITWCGAAFLFYFGYRALKEIKNSNAHPDGQLLIAFTRKQVLTSLLAVTWLNPHVWLDTFVVLGSLGSQFNNHERLAFAFGAMLASLVWFYLLAFLGRALTGLFNNKRALQVINLIVAVIMWGLAVKLIIEAIGLFLAN